MSVSSFILTPALLLSFSSAKAWKSHEVGKSYSVRRECLDHLLILQEKQLQRVLHAYVTYFNRARPHQGSKQLIPEQKAGSVPAHQTSGEVLSFPVLGGLHHDYHRRVETIIARPIHGIIFHPFPRISSACTCWRSSLPVRT